MSHTDYVSERLSHRLPTLLPEYLKEEAPAFEQFIRAYFEFLEAEIITLDSQSDIDGILLEDSQGSIFLEPETVGATPDRDISKIVNEASIGNTNSTADPYVVGEYIFGKTTGAVARIEVINKNVLYVKSISGNGFKSNETIEGRNTKQTAVIKTYKENSILANNKLLDYSDIDHTSEEFLQYYQNDFIPSLDLSSTQNKRLTVKNINDLYQKKGTAESLQFLMRIMFGQDAEVRYPIDETSHVSESDYSQRRRMVVQLTNSNLLPKSTDKIQHLRSSDSFVLAESIIEQVFTLDAAEGIYSLEIMDNHVGTFEKGVFVTFLDRDGITEYTGTTLGVINGVDFNESSIYIEHDDSGVISTEDGDGILFEETGAGSLYTLNDRINFVGQKLDSGVVEAKSIVDGITSGGVEHIYIEDGGTGFHNTYSATTKGTVDSMRSEDGEDYVVMEDSANIITETSKASTLVSFDSALDTAIKEGHTVFGTNVDTVKVVSIADDRKSIVVSKPISLSTDSIIQVGLPQMVVFDNTDTGGSGAEAFIGSVGDEVIQENASHYGQFTYTATANQTLFNGKDDLNRRMFFNDGTVQVFVDGVKRDPLNATSGYTHKNDRVTFINGLSAGAIVDIYREFNNVLYEDGTRMNLETTESNIRSIFINNQGTGYKIVPKVYTGGYIYFKTSAEVNQYEKAEGLTGGTSNATGKVLRLEPNNKRIVVSRDSTDTGTFVAGEIINGTTAVNVATQVNVTSGTGAKIFAWSSKIGGITSVNFESQGYNFDSNGVLGSSSQHNMLIETPTAIPTKDLVLTGQVSGTTATAVSYDADRHILKYSSLNGEFVDGEQVKYNNTDYFHILKTQRFNGQGVMGGEGIIERQFLGDRGQASSSVANIQDGYLYQSHSYVIKVGESINKYRSAVKDLLHPAGHIFFGEVAIKNNISAVPENQFKFVPTIVIYGEPTLGVANAFTNSSRRIQLYTLDSEMNDPLVVLRACGVPSPETNPVTGGAILPYQKVNGVESGRGTEVGDSMMRSRHMNILKIVSKNMAITQSSPRIDGVMSVLNIATANNGYLRVETERRPSDQGKVFQIWEPNNEVLILESGGLIELEEEACILRFEPDKDAEVKGDYGERIISEDGTELLRLESATTVEPVHYFTSERNIEYTGKYMYFEDHDRIVSESGEPIIQDDSSGGNLSSFVPLGSTIRTINTIARQNTYDISYYLKDETNNDDIVLEDGSGNVMVEGAKSEGLKISDLDNMYPKFYIADYENHQRKRTNLTFSAYIKSA